MRFDKAIVIGSGKIACECTTILKEKNIVLEVIENKDNQLSTLKSICKKNEIKYDSVRDHKLLATELLHRVSTPDRFLLISANNEFLFPEKIVNAENITIINFHYSYLPDYRGMNIPSWVIYNGEPYTGVTWHYVNSNIDDGNILIQKKIMLNGMESAFDIVRKGMQLGKEAFHEMIDDFLVNDIKGDSNNIAEPHHYTRTQIPDDGFLNINKTADHITKMLRAFDYNNIAIFPKLKIIVENSHYEIQKYKIETKDNIIGNAGNWNADYIIDKDNIKISLKLMPFAQQIEM